MSHYSCMRMRACVCAVRYAYLLVNIMCNFNEHSSQVYITYEEHCMILHKFYRICMYLYIIYLLFMGIVLHTKCHAFIYHILYVWYNNFNSANESKKKKKNRKASSLKFLPIVCVNAILYLA